MYSYTCADFVLCHTAYLLEYNSVIGNSRSNNIKNLQIESRSLCYRWLPYCIRGHNSSSTDLGGMSNSLKAHTHANGMFLF